MSHGWVGYWVGDYWGMLDNRGVDGVRIFNAGVLGGLFNDRCVRWRVYGSGVCCHCVGKNYRWVGADSARAINAKRDLGLPKGAWIRALRLLATYNDSLRLQRGKSPMSVERKQVTFDRSSFPQ
jgi:hypothetical protein